MQKCETSKNPITCAQLVLNLALRYAKENAMILTKTECEALELTGRNFHRLERLLKVAK